MKIMAFLITFRIFAFCSLIHNRLARTNNAVGCEHRCGVWKHFPCSCHHTCVAYNNCCEDFSEDCPDEFNNGMNKFKRFLTLSSSCIIEGYFVISSCPKKDNDVVNEDITRQYLYHKLLFLPPTNNNDSLEITEFFDDDVQTYSSSNSTLFDLQTILKARPVYDNLTEILFSNYDKFVCNALPNSYPVFWKTEIRMASEKAFQDVKLSQFMIDWNSVRYFQPTSLGNTSVSPLCIPSSRYKCPKKTKFTYPDLYDKCKSSVSYVRLGETNMTFNNEACVSCWLKGHIIKPIYDYTIPDNSPEFSVLLSLSGTTNDFLTRPSVRISVNSWKGVQCGITYKEDSLQTQIDCEPNLCKKSTIQTSDGQCVIGTFLHLAFGEVGKGMGHLKEKKLAKMLSCWLKSNLGYDIIDATYEDSVPSKYFDNVLHKKVYRSIVAVTIDHTNNHVWKMPRHILALDAFSKAFTLYRMKPEYQNRFGASTRVDNSRDMVLERARFFNTLEKRKSTNIPKLNKTLLLQNVHPELFHSIFIEGKRAVNDSLLYSTCFCESNQTELCYMICWESPLYEDDIPFIEALFASECFEAFGARAVNSDEPRNTLSVLWYLILSLCMFESALSLHG